MNKNVLVISTSPRMGGNSEKLAEAFAQGAREAGHEAQIVRLFDKSIAFCKGCLACQKTGRCVIADDMQSISEKMQKADVIAFATPIYFYEMCGQMKTLLDRTNPLFPSDYAFRDIYLLATAADTRESAMERAIAGLQGWVDCFDQATLAGVVCGVGADAVGSIEGNPALQKALDLGRRL